MRITWTRDNREIRPGGNYKMTLVENTASLTVLKVGKGDAGLYTCTASNSVGKDACAAQLAVQGIAVGFSVYEIFFATPHSSASFFQELVGAFYSVLGSIKPLTLMLNHFLKMPLLKKRNLQKLEPAASVWDWQRDL